MNLTWSFMKVRLHCCIEEGKWAIYAAQEVNPWEAHVRDFMNKPNVPPDNKQYKVVREDIDPWLAAVNKFLDRPIEPPSRDIYMSTSQFKAFKEGATPVNHFGGLI